MTPALKRGAIVAVSLQDSSRERQTRARLIASPMQESPPIAGCTPGTRTESNTVALGPEELYDSPP
jgi:hypothetical protein